jgi:hypothetical protein
VATVAQEQSPAQVPDQVPDEKIYLQPEGPWEAKVMDLGDTLKLFAVVGEVMETVMGQEGGFRIAGFIRSLDQVTLLHLLEIATHQTPEWLEENFSFPNALKSMLDFWKKNDLDELWGEIWGVGRVMAQEVEDEETEKPAPDGSQS